ncbi:MAG: hypothetical protein HY934_10940 [Candidatus Firestonebacteria bacterium]|nr:hypothetical protein [Candidatus Firestonebacteria bacterium]
METILEKQINEMSNDELKEIIRRDYIRRLTRYRKTDDFYTKKYNMNFETFQKENIIEKKNYTFEVESDSEEWELAIDGINTIEKRLKELTSGN